MTGKKLAFLLLFTLCFGWWMGSEWSEQNPKIQTSTITRTKVVQIAPEVHAAPRSVDCAIVVQLGVQQSYTINYLIQQWRIDKQFSPGDIINDLDELQDQMQEPLNKCQLEPTVEEVKKIK